jgi:putative transposase
MANLFIDVLRTGMREKRFKIHDFVVMPDHVHILLSLKSNMSIEKAVQIIKGNFSYRARRNSTIPAKSGNLGFQKFVS